MVRLRWWVLPLAVVSMAAAISCQSDPLILEEALDPGTSVPSEEPSPTVVISPLASPSATSTAWPDATADPTRTAQTPVPTEVPTPFETQEPEAPVEVLEPTSVPGPTASVRETVYSVSPLEMPLPGGTNLVGEPFGTTGDIPPAIIASTEQCDIVSVDSRTGAVRILADFSVYSGKARVFGNCSDQGLEYQHYSGTAEVAPGFIEDVEWVDPKYVLIGNCCEPAVGRFEVLDIEEHNRPYWLALNGSYPSVNGRGELVFSELGASGGLASFGTVPLVISYDDSNPSHPFFTTAGDVSYHHLMPGDGEGSSPNSFATRTSWVEGNSIALGIWTLMEDQGFFPWVMLIDLDIGPIAANARGLGWMLPTGDQLGNLVVAEQHCFGYLSECIGSLAKIVVVDSQALVPLYEVDVDDTIVDMDLVRGWLLVTLVDGRMGILDLADGTFNVLAYGIRNAVWQE